MDEILPDIDRDLDVIFGEFRDHQVVQSFVQSVRDARFTGTLYIGYPVLTIDDDRIEFDAVLISRDHGVLIFDLYSFDGGVPGIPTQIPPKVVAKQEQLYAALFNKLNSFRELRRGRSLMVDLVTITVHPLVDTFVREDDALLIGLNRLGEIRLLEPADQLNDEQIRHLNAAVQRISNLKPQKKRDNVVRHNSKGAAIKEIEQQIANLDLWQKRGSIEYVNGPQRIRGLAGSGKTVVLALKAAYLHVKRPDWDIVVSFNTRSLYQQFEALITRFVFAQIGEEPDWTKLHVMHAWGGADRKGVYLEAANKIGCQYRDFGTAARLFGYETAFDGACKEVLTALGDRELELYDMILIDEAQDLPPSFFQVVYRMVKEPRRIVWAYDDLQNLGDFYMPSEAELFGYDAQSRPRVSLRNEVDHPQQDIVLPRCYRNPPWTLVTAHGIGFGVKRNPMVQMFPDPKLWLRLGYEIKGGSLAFDHDVIVDRNPKSIPDFFSRLLTPGDSLQTSRHTSAQEQYTWVAKKIKHLIDDEELQHSDFLVVMPNVRTSRSTGASVLAALRAEGLQGHIPGQTSSRDEVFREGSIAITHIHRAKGNEAPAVFVVDAQFCEGENEIKRRRNILFTAITRSRAWTYITGIGENMGEIEREIAEIRAANYQLAFHYPTREEVRQLAVSSDSAQDELPLGNDEFDDIRLALKKARQIPWDKLPPDLRRDLMDVYGQGA
ncbi:MAG: ATP-binding domain-containing protein [Gluconobacter cerinus]|uniref:DNA 3'-5' helicase II n=1 Tax=Gluconacetobacter dulcium TaxID=2729096 RepID=A0A7W4K3I3_9PROT|nr:ATP-binding domain-containing protein [Gluconacetobacter dulcium]MBB2199708.1 ATP-binding domain-containing protein [Gluconacetobacter dulcium]